MQFSVTQKELDVALRRVVHVAPNNSTLPILSNVLIEAADGVITLSTTSLEALVRTTLNVPVASNGAVTVEARRLADVVKQYGSDDNLSFTYDPDLGPRLSVTNGTINASLNTLPTSEFPVLNFMRDEQVGIRFTVPAPEFVRAFNAAATCASTDDTRAVLMAVHVVSEKDRLRFEATDGFCLGTSYFQSEAAPDLDVLWPAKIVSKLLSTTFAKIAELTIKIGSHSEPVVGGTGAIATYNVVEINSAKTQAMFKTQDGTYPDTQAVAIAPKTISFSATLNLESMKSALSLCMAAVKGLKLPPVHLSFFNTPGSTYYALDSDYAEGGEGELPRNDVVVSNGSIPASEKDDDGVYQPSVVIALNGKILENLLPHVSDPHVRLDITNSLSAIGLTGLSPTDPHYIVMPMTTTRVGNKKSASAQESKSNGASKKKPVKA